MRTRVFLFAFLFTLMVSASKPKLGHKFKPSADSNQSFLSKIGSTFSKIFHGSKHEKEESQVGPGEGKDQKPKEADQKQQDADKKKKEQQDADKKKKEQMNEKPNEPNAEAKDAKASKEKDDPKKDKPTADAQVGSGDEAAEKAKEKAAKEAAEKEKAAKEAAEKEKAAKEEKKEEPKNKEEAAKAKKNKEGDKTEEVQTGETIANTNADVELSLPEPFWKTDALSLAFFIIGLLFITTFVYSMTKRERASDTLYVELKDDDDFEV